VNQSERDKKLEEELAKAKVAIIEEITNRPPTIGLIGVSGTGKSSTINALFGTELPVSDVVACTKEFRDTDMSAVVTEGEAKGHRASLRVVDAPGLGEDVARDPDYLAMYHEHLPKCDVILWVLTARNRAIALDQIYLEKLDKFHERIVFGINQVDLVEPVDWERTNLPSKTQLLNIETIVGDRKEKLESVIGREIKIIPYSAKRYYNLPELFRNIIESCPSNRAWIFGALKGFTPYSGVPENIRKEIKKMVESQPNEGSKPSGKIKSFPFFGRK
jgi:predicted GTPase